MIALITSNPFLKRLSEGGTGMYFILIAFLLSIVFIVLASIKKNKNVRSSNKMIGLAAESSLVALVMGCLASVMGIIELFDMLEAIGETRPDLFAAGIKVSLLTITFGLFSFTVARIGILAYKWSLNSDNAEQ
ncbi:MotA/TolQ/ExbB proton channel family protein [Winogradskyella jejuensis]|uniref:MotA/TolQ/ExbB proton channel family protein n=1 Tax=Winogradskyella jejuensis TaxID=1089305 RepID=A0A1M5T6X8_9FLAO|nr:MotA/TolQ/ExbB proton channel family protein [Winogradskyella jejuensis]SHH46438.1 MotA/TolQ/ExbB proton channel family protein [Winogradskyella jejuensis]